MTHRKVKHNQKKFDAEMSNIVRSREISSVPNSLQIIVGEEVPAEIVEHRFCKRRAKGKKYYERNRERLLDQHHDYYQKNKHRRSMVGAKQTRQIYHERLMALISDNDLKCAWCGFSNIRALQIDHKQGGGSIQHAKQFSNRASFYKHYLDRPELAKNELQLLCANCNIIKRNQLYKSPIKGGNLNRAD